MATLAHAQRALLDLARSRARKPLAERFELRHLEDGLRRCAPQKIIEGANDQPEIMEILGRTCGTTQTMGKETR